MRSLQTRDIFAAARMVNKIGIKEEIKKILMEADSIEDIAKKKDEIGYEVLFSMFEKTSEKNGEKAIYEFLSGIFEMTVKEIEVMDPVECMDNILKCADVEKWKSFFSRVASSMK